MKLTDRQIAKLCRLIRSTKEHLAEIDRLRNTYNKLIYQVVLDKVLSPEMV